MLVEDCDKLNYFIPDAKIHGVRKPAKQCSSNVVLDLGKLEWTLDHALEDRVELVEQLATKPDPLLLVPCSGVAQVELSLWRDREASGHRLGLRLRSFARSSSRNSSQDLPARELA